MKRKDFRHFQSSVRFRTLSSILMMVLLVGALTLIEFYYLDDVYLFLEKRNLVGLSEEIAQYTEMDDEAKKALSDIESKNNVYIEIYHPRSELIYTTETNDAVFEPVGKKKSSSEMKPRIMKILTHEETDDWSYFETRREYYTTASYIVYGTTLESDLSIVIYASLDTINANARSAFWVFFLAEISLFAIVLIVFLIHFFTVSRPIDQISQVTKGIAQMDFNQVCPSYRITELNELSEHINSLSASLDLTLRTLKRRNAQLEDDIEKEKKSMEARKEFIASASHELKTPLAVIQGYAEGLKYGVYKNKEDACYDIILEEAQKMNALVLELLETSRMTAGAWQPHYETMALREKVDTTFDQMKTIFIKNAITAENIIDPSYVSYADPTLFDRVFSNYLSNAISHCAGEKKIEVSAKIVDGCYRVSVFNTGTPIAEADLEHIWTSFYRADKARSRKEGRFGLGLSIVHSAQEQQGLKCGVINHEDGVEFWFDLHIKE